MDTATGSGTGSGPAAARDTRPVAFRDAEALLLGLERRGSGRRRAAEGVVPEENGLVGRQLCHDLRQPLATAAALVAGMQAEPDLSADGRHRLHLLKHELAQLTAMIDDALAPAEPTLTGLTSLAREACVRQDALGAAPVELVVTADPVVAGDPVQLQRLLGNLLGNARSAASPQGHVRLVVGRWQGQALLQVDDDGGRARRGSSSPSSGLGLLIVRGIVDRHRGRLDCGPSDLGGLRFRVLLPLALPEQSKAELP